MLGIVFDTCVMRGAFQDGYRFRYLWGECSHSTFLLGIVLDTRDGVVPSPLSAGYCFRYPCDEGNISRWVSFSIPMGRVFALHFFAGYCSRYP